MGVVTPSWRPHVDDQDSDTVDRAAYTCCVLDRSAPGCAIDASRVYVAGFSAGGAMAAVMAAAYPGLYAAAGVHPGLPHRAAHNLPSALAAMRRGASPHSRPSAARIPMIVFHGDHDPMVNHVNADRLVDQGIRAFSTAADHGDAPRHAVTTRRGKGPGGHSYTRAVYQDANQNTLIEHWTIHGGGHAWSGGSRPGSYTDPQGPDGPQNCCACSPSTPEARAFCNARHPADPGQPGSQIGDAPTHC